MWWIRCQKIPLILWGGGLFCHQNQSCLKLPEMDRSEVKKISFILRGGGGLFCHQNQNSSKLPEMDRSSVKHFPSLGGGLFCHQNQNCSKLPEMDRSEVKKFSLILVGGGFSATKIKVAQSCLKWIDWRSKIFLHAGGGGGLFCHQNQSCLKLPEMDRSEVKIFPSSWRGGGLFCH